jgi:hypothetical protein
VEVERKLEGTETRLEKAEEDGNEKMIQLYGDLLIELRRKDVELRRKDVELRRELVELRIKENKLIPESTGIIH